MFDFEKLDVYQKMREVNRNLLPFIFEIQVREPYLCDELKKASLRAMLSLSEGTGAMDIDTKRSLYVKSRSSIFECVSILHVLLDTGALPPDKYENFYSSYETISKMMLGMVRGVKEN